MVGRVLRDFRLGMLVAIGKGQLIKLPRMLSMLAGRGRPVWVAKPLLQLRRPLVQLDRWGVRGHLLLLGERRPLTGAVRLLRLRGHAGGLVSLSPRVVWSLLCST
jgi:hypothetical protein